MKVMKRNGTEVIFDITKIIAAITKANNTIEEDARMTPVQIQRIAESVELSCQKMNRSPSVEEIQDLVESQIMAHGAYEVAKNYITYRYVRSLVRKSNTTDEKILSLIECCNEEAKQENSNKNPVVNSTQRDYMAGEVSRDLSERLLLPADIVEAHREGIIHFHDSDYYAQHMHNCDLVNLEDMLQNGTVITDTLIERPHSFSTACNIATQIIAQVASNQYGGQSISLAHLAPFVDVSRKKIRRLVEQEMETLGIQPSQEKIEELVETRLRDEVRRGVQTIQYQVLTLLTTNGQAPFVTVFMYLGEAKNEQEKKDLALNERWIKANKLKCTPKQLMIVRPYDHQPAFIQIPVTEWTGTVDKLEEGQYCYDHEASATFREGKGFCFNDFNDYMGGVASINAMDAIEEYYRTQIDTSVGDGSAVPVRSEADIERESKAKLYSRMMLSGMKQQDAADIIGVAGREEHPQPVVPRSRTAH